MSASSSVISRPYTVPRSGGGGPAIALAVVMHLLLGGLLFFGIRWQSSAPEVINAELWSAMPQTAAPAPTYVPPPPKVEAPRPVPKVEEPPPVKPDIAEKTQTKVEPPKKKEPPKVEAPKVQPKPEPPKPQPKPVENAKAPSDLANLLAAAGTPSTGKDQQTSGPRGRDSYIARLQNAIRTHMRYPASCPSATKADVKIEQLPNGEVANVTITRASGVPSFDEAVDRAIRAASPLPRDEQGKVERVLDITYNLCEKN